RRLDRCAEGTGADRTGVSMVGKGIVGRASPRRLLWWTKFLMTLLLGSACLAKAFPTLERLLPLSRTRYVFSPEPLLLPALLSLAVLVILGWSVLDAVLDRRMPPAGPAALVAFPLVPSGARRALAVEAGWLARRAPS